MKLTNPDGGIESTQYDALGNIVKQTDADGNENRYSYTAENLLSRVIYPDGETLSYDYDKLGNVTSETSPEGGQRSMRMTRSAISPQPLMLWVRLRAMNTPPQTGSPRSPTH